MKKEDPRFYIPITRVDEEKRMVYGYATTEAVDSYGTVIDLDSVKRCLPDYLQWRNIREMHQPSAVGRADDITLDENGLYIGAKIIDDQAWKKVKEGVYKGFSVGGKKDYQEDDRIFMKRINEISLADRPSNEDCVFDTFRIYQEKEGDAVEKADATKQEVDTGGGGENDIARYIGEEAYDAQTAIYALTSIMDLLNKEQNEAEKMPDQIEALAVVVEKLKDFIASEIKEDHSVGMMRIADFKIGDDLTLEDGTVCRLIGPETEAETIERIGKEMSKKNVERIQAMHDHTVAMGADCGGAKRTGEGSDVIRIDGFEQDGKPVDIRGIEELKGVAETFFKRIVELESQPAPTDSVTRAIPKEQDLGVGDAGTKAEEPKTADEAIKRIHAAGGQRITI